jgi:hypothetical protein
MPLNPFLLIIAAFLPQFCGDFLPKKKLKSKYSR